MIGYLLGPTGRTCVPVPDTVGGNGNPNQFQILKAESGHLLLLILATSNPQERQLGSIHTRYIQDGKQHELPGRKLSLSLSNKRREETAN
jgi:hypothetical protein